MTILKCKMCGGDIQATDAAFGTCDSCGVTSTLPKASDDRIVNIFNRANHFRRLNEFDKAAVAYENIIYEDSANAEAHWGLLLCHYGIEYVEDPATNRHIPTCHRVRHESILSDPDYLAVLEHAPDEYTKSLYQEEAAKISEVQNDILAISSMAEPYDVFICYKETTADGSRTKDSVIAQDVYSQLSNEGYRVFFAKITLEDKLGQQYEPYIFGALNSAKVMLVIGTRREHFEAVWVKNEWSRFLSIVKNDRSRLLIPCYCDMDAYDIPDELANLQSQDMSKIGAIQDLVRGVKKILDAGKTSDADKQKVPQQAEQTTNRGFTLLEEEDWEQAKTCFNLALSMDAKYAPAYIGLLCADLELKKEEYLAFENGAFENDKNFKKALGFADTDYRKKLEGYVLRLEEEQQKTKRQFDEIKPVLAEIRGRIAKYKNCISAATYHTVGLKKDGTVVSVGYGDNGQCDTGDWRHIVAISTGFSHTVGLKTDGTVVSIGHNASGQCNTGEWTDITAISAGYKGHTVGLKKDGTVVAVGENEYGQCNTHDWQDIVAISAGRYHTVGLKADGTVAVVGNNDKGQCNTENWRNIVAISSTYDHTVGLKADGTVDAVGDEDLCKTKGWSDIVAISAGRQIIVGLRASGTVVAVWPSYYAKPDTKGWRDIVSISEGGYIVVGLKADGTVVVEGSNDYGQCNTTDWRDIVAIYTASNHTVGLKADGTVVVVGENGKGECNIEDWRDIGPVDKEQCLQRMREEKVREEQRKQDLERLRLEKQRRIEQSKKWEDAGLCRYCGGKLSFFGKTCKSCGQKNYK